MKKLLIGTLVLVSTTVYSQKKNFSMKEHRAYMYTLDQIYKDLDSYSDLFINGPKSQPTEKLVKRCFDILKVDKIGFGSMFQSNVYSGISLDKKPVMIFGNTNDNSLASLDLREAERKLKNLNPQQHIIRHNGEVLIAKIVPYKGKNYWQVGPYDGSVPRNTPSTISLTPHKANSSIRNAQMKHIKEAAEKKLREIANDPKFKANATGLGACRSLASRLGDKDFEITISQITKKSDANSNVARNKKEDDYRSLSSSADSSSPAGTNK